MSGHEDGACLRQGSNADGAPHVVGEDGEGGAVRNDACATKRKRDRRHEEKQVGGLVQGMT